jgi:hypothetical protein
MMRDRVSQLGDDNAIDREGADRRRGGSGAGKIPRALLPIPDDRGAILLGMVYEAGATARADYDVEVTVAIEEYEQCRR